MKLLNFKVILADFWPKYLEAVAMATERQMSELALNFLVLPRKNHCQQFCVNNLYYNRFSSYREIGPSQVPDHAKVYGPAEDYILSLHQQFLIQPTACVSKLRMKETFAKTTLATSVTNTPLSSVLMLSRVGRTFFKE